MKPLTGVPILAGQSMYDAFTAHATIPFDYRKENVLVPFTVDVSMGVQIESDSGLLSRTYHPIIDTGSCGFVISAADLPDWDRTEASQYPVGWEFLSSSKILYSGRWLPKNIYFPDAEVEVQARVPILAVETRTHCPQYNATRDKNTCPSVTGQPPQATQLPSGIRVMGVGFGREHDGMPQGTPDKNVFINIRRIDGRRVRGRAWFRSGYILNRHGVTVGLTGRNTAGMRFTELSLREEAVSPRDWAQADGCMGVDGAPCVRGPVLIDTGVSQMYMTLPLGSKAKRTHPPVLNDGSLVSVQVGLGYGDRYTAEENFTVGDRLGMDYDVVPSSVRLTLANPMRNPPHVNTGRHFLRAWEFAFDSDGGFFGLRET